MAKRTQVSVLIVASTWWPLTARLAMSLLAHGCRVSALCPAGHPMRFVEGISSVHMLRAYRPMRTLKRTIEADKPDVILPGDDTVVWLLHQTHALYPELRPLIERSLGNAAFYPEIRGRDALLQVARELGIRTPVNAVVKDVADLDAWLETNPFPAVMKVDGSFSGRGVVVVHSREECVAVLERFQRRSSFTSAGGRWVVNRNPLALWTWRLLKTATVSIQQWIPGTQATAMFAAWEGKVLGGLAVEVLATTEPQGASTVVRPVQDVEMLEAGRRIAERLGISGFFGLDFMLDDATGKPYLLELNPRCTQLGHLRVQGMPDLAGVLAAAIAGGPPPEAGESLPEGPIAFFPQALGGDPKTRELLPVSYLDKPVEQPKLVEALNGKAWPEQQLASRVYLKIRG